MQYNGLAMKKKPNEIVVNIEIPVDMVPVFVNISNMSRLNDSFFLDLGFVDPQEFISYESRVQNNKEEGAEYIRATIKNRFAMSVDTLQSLKKNIDDIYKKAVEEGVIQQKS